MTWLGHHVLLKVAWLWVVMLSLLGLTVGVSMVVTGVLLVGPVLVLVAFAGIFTGRLSTESVPMLVVASLFSALTLGTLVSAAVLADDSLTTVLGLAGVVLNVFSVLALWTGVRAGDDASSDPLPAHLHKT